MKLDYLRLLLRPFSDRNRAIVATWLDALCVASIFLAQSTYAFAMPADFEFPKVDRAAGGVTSQEGQLVNSRPPEVLVTHIFMRMFHRKFATK